MRARYRAPVKPPPGHLTLNRSHPLAQNLIVGWVINENAGNRLHNVARSDDPGTITDIPWATNVGGVHLNPDGSTGADTVVNSRTVNIDQDSIALGFSLDVLPSAASFLCGFYEGGSFEKNIVVTAANALEWHVQTAVIDPVALNAGQMYSALGVQDHLANVITLYKNGQSVGSTNSMSFLGYTTPAIHLAGATSIHAAVAFRAYYMYVWSRALTPTEAWELYKDPYGFLMPVSPRVTYFVFNQGGGGGAANNGKIWSPALISHPALLT